MAALLEPMEKEAAKERQGERTDKHHGNSPGCSNGPAADKVAEAVGMSRQTLAKAKAVVEAAKKDPENCGPIKRNKRDKGMDPAAEDQTTARPSST
jgi:hypothetical protein